MNLYNISINFCKEEIDKCYLTQYAEAYSQTSSSGTKTLGNIGLPSVTILLNYILKRRVAAKKIIVMNIFLEIEQDCPCPGISQIRAKETETPCPY